MRDVLPHLHRWWQDHQDVVMATVVGNWRSAPRPPGAAMVIGPDHAVVGSVSGGCVESDVCAVAEQVLRDGRPVRRRYGVSDRDAFAVGLTCGGVVDVFIQRVNRETFPELGLVAAAVADQRSVTVATVVAHRDQDQVGRRMIIIDDQPTGTLGQASTDGAATAKINELTDRDNTALMILGSDGDPHGCDLQVFVEHFPIQPRMLIFGANDFATALARLSSVLGYRATVCDARPLFATTDRVPQASEVIVDWPHRYLAAEQQAGRLDARTVICVLTHDPKFDIPLLRTALTLPVPCYVGAMGSRRTHVDRIDQLTQGRVGPAELGRLSSPIGLDLGARTPEETAVSILAEIIASRGEGTGSRLRDTHGPIHHDVVDSPGCSPPAEQDPPRPLQSPLTLPESFIDEFVAAVTGRGRDR